MALLFALLLAIFSTICFKAGKKGFGLTSGVVAVLLFIGWLHSGPGFAILEWFNDPSVDVPDNIHVPGQ